ncbi:adenylate/guanylate cyclase domain-containing protein [Mycetocola tolaasinivorans]|uniref:Adenylate/guanylate cyclase domain-containing protein n=1 Tax=Mycetocola tolaasinivorans TaxID=76635 RepID=A0A3L7A6X5_9MICO|nr:adenylate/guanylate cyclase domain-containing protein [Mycetocola tolaasinivorans]RLP76069.1 adenylate/guanylate cyclase domain-containing protein [Mycetocola tolaasinivorans]
MTESRTVRRVFRRPAGGLGIQSKLLIMLLAVSLISIIVTGIIGYANGRDSLNAAAFKQLTTIRELRANEVENAIQTIQTNVRLNSITSDTAEASVAFNDGFRDLDQAGPYPTDRERVLSFYRSSFIPQLEQRSGQRYDAIGLLPNNNAGVYLQARYTSGIDNYDETLTVNDAGDGSAWSAAHARYHPYFRDLIDNLGYEDMVLINTEGQIVYTAYKGVDLGLNLFDTPENQSALSKAVSQVLRSDSVNTVVTTDFERYVPSLDVPTAWIVSPVGTREGGITGVLAAQVPIQQLNDTLTGAESWEAQGLGKSGEVYLVGEDHLMRSVSRALVEHPETYEKAAISNGLPPATAKRIVEVKGTVLLQEINTTPVERALKGQNGTSLATGYLGIKKLSSYAPLRIDNGPRWVVVASIDEAEAFAPVEVFTRIVMLSAGALVLIVAVIALLLARVFIRPLNRLLGGVRRVSSGERDVTVDTGTRDEFAEVGSAFNELSRSLQTKADLLDAERAERDRLLLSLMPEAVAERYRQGDEAIAEDHSDVTVVYADFIGFDDYATGMNSGQSLAALNEILTGMDDLAERYGVERVRTTKQGYLASCGLNVPRVDSARRVIEFAHAAELLVSRLSSQWGTNLALRAGVDSGSVTSGLIGRTSVVYDMWGEAVNLAYRLQDTTGDPGILISQRVVDRLGDLFPVTSVGMVETAAGSQQVWRLDMAASGV